MKIRKKLVISSKTNIAVKIQDIQDTIKKI